MSGRPVRKSIGSVVSGGVCRVGPVGSGLPLRSVEKRPRRGWLTVTPPRGRTDSLPASGSPQPPPAPSGHAAEGRFSAPRSGRQEPTGRVHPPLRAQAARSSLPLRQLRSSRRRAVDIRSYFAGLRSPIAHRYDDVRMKSCPSETAIVLRQYGAQSLSSRFDDRISNVGPARKTVVSPSSSVVT